MENEFLTLQNEPTPPLWAPWRIEFIRSEKQKKCFLCANDKQFTDVEEELIIAKYEHVFCILNRFPYNSGHLMIAPFRHIGDFCELTKAERHELIDIVPQMLTLLRKVMRPDGFNTGFNFGLAAGAGVADHIHFHIVPRWVGDNNFMPVLNNIRVVPETLVKTAELLRANLTQ